MDGTSEAPTSPAGPVRQAWWRRWWWGVLLLLVAIPAVRVAWHYRPLNAAERRMVGIWKFRVTQGMEPPAEILLTLTGNRRFKMSMVDAIEEGEEAEPGYGSWSSTWTELSVRNDGEAWSWALIRWMADELMAGRNPFSGTASVPLEFVDGDHVTFGPVPEMANLTVDMTRIGMPSGNEDTAIPTEP